MVIGRPANAVGAEPKSRAATIRAIEISRDIPTIRRAKARLGFAFVIPAVLLSLVFVVTPVAIAIYLSLSQWNGLSADMRFVGFDNFLKLSRDPIFGGALANNLIWIVIGTLTPLVLGTLLALLLWAHTAGSGVYRLLFFVPYILPSVVISLVWTWIYNPLNGWANRILGSVGLSSLQQPWLAQPKTVIYVILFAAIWGATGFSVLILFSALQGVDEEYVDAARINGANLVQIIWHVILPQIAPVLVILTIYTLVGGFTVFDIVFIMTGGGPSHASDVIGTYAYQMAFDLSETGYGTAAALLIAVFALPCVILLNWVQRRLELRELI